MVKKDAAKMIFYDIHQKRKFYFRFISFTLFSILLIGFICIAVSIVNAKSSMDFLEDTEKYYDYYYGPENDKKITLTFDDGPNPVYTKKVMEVLLDQNVPATFFLLGEKVLQHESVVRELSDNGFALGNHSFTHSQDVHESEQRLKLELVTTGKLIEKITGEKPLFYRPPFLLNIGIDPTINPYTEEQEPLVWAARQGYIPVGADVDSKDWLLSSPEEVLKNTKENISHGHILLLHDGVGSGSDKVIKILEQMIVELKAEGYEFVSLSEVLGITKNISFKNDLHPATSDAITGGRISELQKFLQQEKNPDIEISGYYDVATDALVKKWEEEYGVSLHHGYQLASTDEETSGEVSKLQRFLKDEGETTIAVSGYYDEQTQQAVGRWQEKNIHMSPGDDEYGSVLEKTRSAIESISESTPATFSPQESVFRLSIKPILMDMEYAYLNFVTDMGQVIFLIVKILLVLVIARISFVFLLLSYSFLKKNKVSKSWEKGVTAIVPAYNEQENVASTIQSLLRNNFPLLEVIVVDDGSTDNTAEVVREVQKQHPNTIRLISLENGGKARALNIGFQEAKYEVIVAMDGDTIYAKDSIGKLVRHFTDESVGAVAGRVCVVNNGKMLSAFQNIEYISGQSIEKQAFASINAVSVVPGAVGAWRKADVLACGGYSVDTLVEDQDLTLAILKMGKRVVYDSGAVSYTETPSTTRDFVKQRFRWVFGTMQCIWKYKKILFHWKSFSLGWIVLPNIVLFNIIIPLFSFFADIVLLFTLFFGVADGLLKTYLLFTLFDFLYTAIAFRDERKDFLKTIPIIPLQRLFYRQIMCYVIIKSIIKAIEGTHALWGKLQRTGQAQKYFDDALSENPQVTSSITVPVS